MKAKLGVIFGTSKTNLPWPERKTMGNFHRTPFGETPELVTVLNIDSHDVVTINRHGDGHVFSPSSVNYRAIIWKMKELGVTHLLSFSAVGSLKETIVPGKTIVVPIQIYDDTKSIRKHTFFEGANNLVAHVSLADPICPQFASRISDALTKCDLKALGFNGFQHGGTYVVIEGPTFSTRAKSLFYKEILHADLVGMTAWPEAPLAREAGMHYGMICSPADYDSWRGGCAGVTADEVKVGLAPFAPIPELILPLLARSLQNEPEKCHDCPASLDGFAFHSDPNKLSWEIRKRYEPLLPGTTRAKRGKPE